MTVVVWGHTIHCLHCGTIEMSLVVDELVGAMTGSREAEVIKCKRCFNLFSKEFIEDNFDEFISEEDLERIQRSYAFKSRWYG